MKRTPLKRKAWMKRSAKPMARKTPIRRVSKKRQAENAEYARLRAEFLEAHPYCAVFPKLRSTQVHHGMGREGEWLLRTEYWHAVSDEGHRKIETDRQWAAAHGFLNLRLTTDQLATRDSALT